MTWGERQNGCERGGGQKDIEGVKEGEAREKTEIMERRREQTEL